MKFNKYQNILWNKMISLIDSFKKGDILFTTLVYSLEGVLDAGEFKDESLVENWYNHWTPLEILSATKGHNTTIEDVDKDISSMEKFLKSYPEFTKPPDFEQ